MWKDVDRERKKNRSYIRMKNVGVGAVSLHSQRVPVSLRCFRCSLNRDLVLKKRNRRIAMTRQKISHIGRCSLDPTTSLHAMAPRNSKVRVAAKSSSNKSILVLCVGAGLAATSLLSILLGRRSSQSGQPRRAVRPRSQVFRLSLGAVI